MLFLAIRDALFFVWDWKAEKIPIHFILLVSFLYDNWLSLHEVAVMFVPHQVWLGVDIVRESGRLEKTSWPHAVTNNSETDT